MRKICALVLWLFSWSVQATEYYVTPAESNRLKTILSDGTLRPGDEVILRDGVYADLGSFDFSAQGTATDSIKLRAEHPGKAVISGALTMWVYGQYLQMEGLFFHKAWSKELCLIEFQKEKGVYASHCRFTNCVIDDCNDPQKSEKPVKGMDPITVSEYWLGLHGRNIRVDHCYFANKRIGGLVLQIWLDEHDRWNNHQIDHNVFGVRPPYGGNGAETIRIGNSWSSQLEAHTVVEKMCFCIATEKMRLSPSNVATTYCVETCSLNHAVVWCAVMGTTILWSRIRLSATILQELAASVSSIRDIRCTTTCCAV